MATFRVGVGSFNINDGAVGIGTEGSGHGNLNVEGVIKSTNLDVLGVSTFTRYSGFNADEVNVNNRDLTLSGEYSTTGDIVVEDGASLTVGLGSTACVGSVECISVKHHFSVPVGDTAQRNETSGYAEGTVKYNRDLGTMEFFNGNEWRQFTYIADTKTNPQGRGRGVFGGGGPQYSMDYVNFASIGNAVNFGDMSTASGGGGDSAGNETRGIFSGHGPNYRAMQYITFASEGRTVTFGDSTYNTSPNASTKVCTANSTRFLNMGDYQWTNAIDYVQITTIGNATDFGDLTAPKAQATGFSSPIKAMYAGGYSPGNTFFPTIEAVTIASTGNAIDFGDMTNQVKTNGGGSGNNTRGIISGGSNKAGSYIDNIDQINLSSGGNATSFGNLTIATGFGGSASNLTRSVYRGGDSPRGNTIDFIQIATGGNAQDFGDTAAPNGLQNGMSDSHGGLGGY